MPSARRALGNFGEATAAAHLRAKGATLLAQGWRCRNGEIDLVAQMGDQLLFVEVRTTRSGGTAPEESVGPAKRARLRLLAYAYLEANSQPLEGPWRIDLIAVEVDARGRVTRLEHIEGIVEE